MFERFINLFKGHAQGQKTMQVMPVGQGRTITVDANGDMVFTTCIEILAKQISQLKWSLYGNDNKEIETLMKQFRFALNQSPYPVINAFDFWGYMEKQRLSTGNALAYISTNDMGMLQHLVPLDGGRVKIYWDTANVFQGKRKLIYESTDPVSNQTYTILPEEVLHVKAFAANGIVGRPAIQVLRDTLQSNAEVESALRSAVANGYHGTIILQYTSDLSERKQMELQNRIAKLFKNGKNSILPLPVGMTATNIANDIKPYYDVLKQANAQAISSFFGIPLVMLNIGGGTGMATFSSNQITQYYNLTIAPIIQAYANELSVKLLTRNQINKGYTFDSAGDAFDWLDQQAKASVLCSYKSAGILSADEVRTSLKYPARGGMADELTSANAANQGTLGDSPNNEGGRGNKGGEE